MKHLNELEAKYADKGLSILAVTSEGAAKTEPWIAKHKATYGYAYDRSGSLMRELGGTGYPSAALITPDGMIAWTGHPSGLNDVLIEKALEGALKKPVWDWPSQAKPVVSALAKKKYAKAISTARKLALKSQDEELDAIGNAIEAMVKSKVLAARKKFNEGDFLGAKTMTKALQKQLKGLPEVDEIKAIAAEIKANPEASKIIKAQKTLKKVRSEIPDAKRRKHVDVLIKKAKSAVKKLSDTFANISAEKLLQTLRARRAKLK